MKPEIKAKWAKALRSGEYSQGRLSLRSSEGFCCLGVLCDLHSQETGVPFNIDYNYRWNYRGERKILPEEVMDWAGLKSNNPKLSRPYLTPAGRHAESLAEMNDNQATFEEIADVIEGQL